MEQYENSGPKVEKNEASNDPTERIKRLEIRMDELSSAIDKQNREMRRLTNELRVAVNAFNLKQR